MASAEHLELSNYIKSVHENLRKRAIAFGPDNAWLEHNKDELTLQRYAETMKQLATKYWDSRSKSDVRAVSRINWVWQMCRDYFEGDGLQKCREREEEVARKANFVVPVFYKSFEKPYQLLDVGSCYDPFGVFADFQTTSIDIAPAVSSVYKCDFLNVSTSPKISSEANEILSLPENFYDIVVFSLVLEYLPSADQRSSFCTKAYHVLKPEGLLFIITPDSKHVGANFEIMKTWRFLLAEQGFSRIKYEKLPHIHCMAFRKSSDCRITQRWATLHRDHNFYNAFVIPQDFNEGSKNADQQEVDKTYENSADLLSCLPFFTNDLF